MKCDTPLAFDGLTQVVAYAPWLFSGSKPTEEHGFKSLRKMDVQTIVCVDGVAPHIKTPEQFGMRTIHIPLKYGKPTTKQIVDLATAVKIGKRRGNTYIHCHHGKHRSAAAAAIALIALDLSTAQKMTKRMHVSKTSTHYEGLWVAVHSVVPIDESACLLNENSLTSKVYPMGLTAQMIAIDEALDNLERMEMYNLEVPEDHPDLHGAAEAGILSEAFRQLGKSEAMGQYPIDFSERLTQAWSTANELEKELLSSSPSAITLANSMRALEQSCTTCHRAYRN